jgi:hypothetical protein
LAYIQEVSDPDCKEVPEETREKGPLEQMVNALFKAGTLPYESGVFGVLLLLAYEIDQLKAKLKTGEEIDGK